MANLTDDYLERQAEGNELIYMVLSRYRELMGKNCYIEKPRTDLQEAMQNLEKWYIREVPHNPQINSDLTCIECGMMNGGHMPGCKMVKLD